MQPNEEINNAFLALLSRYRVKGHKVDTWLDHRYDPEKAKYSGHVDLCKMLDGLALAGVSSVNSMSSGQRNHKWRVLATALLSVKYKSEKDIQLQLVVAENEPSNNVDFEIPRLYGDIWKIFCEISSHGGFNPKARDPAPPALHQLHQELLLRYFSFSFTRFAARLTKHIGPFGDAIEEYLKTDQGSQSPSFMRLSKLKETFNNMFLLCTTLRKLRGGIKKPAAGTRPDDEHSLTLLKLWDQVKLASEFATHNLMPDGPENLLKDCEQYYKKPHESSSEKPNRLARYVKKVLTYLTVYNDFLYFAHGDEMAKLRTERIVFPDMIVGNPATVDPSPDAGAEKCPGLFRADLGGQTFSRHAALKISDWPNVKAALIADLGALARDPGFENHLKLTLKKSIVHCEVAILQYITNFIGAEKVSPHFPFIGVSKSTCRACAIYFAAYNLVDATPIVTRKMHDFVDIPWAIPAVNNPDTANRIAMALQKVLIGQLTDHEPGSQAPSKGPVAVESTKHMHRDSGSTSFSS